MGLAGILGVGTLKGSSLGAVESKPLGWCGSAKEGRRRESQCAKCQAGCDEEPDDVDDDDDDTDGSDEDFGGYNGRELIEVGKHG